MRVTTLAIVICLVATALAAQTVTMNLVSPQGGSLQWSYYSYVGGGYAWSSPQFCGVTPTGLATSCTVSLQRGTVVQLTAVPLSGAPFQGWTGACSGSGIVGSVSPKGTSCNVTMLDGYTVGATIPCGPGQRLVNNVCVSNKISGRVTTDGATGVAGVRLTLTGTTSKITTTDTQGNYMFSDVALGTFSLTASGASNVGFDPPNFSGILTGDLTQNFTGPWLQCPSDATSLDNSRCVSLTWWGPGALTEPGTQIAFRTQSSFVSFGSTTKPLAKWVGLSGANNALDAIDDRLQSRDLFTVTTYDSGQFGNPWYILKAANGMFLRRIEESPNLAASADMSNASLFSRNADSAADWRGIDNSWQNRESLLQRYKANPRDWTYYSSYCIVPVTGGMNYVAQWMPSSYGTAPCHYDFYIVK